MLKVGITGGIGSGKSIVSRVFKSMNIPVYDSDSSAKLLMECDPEIRRKLTGLFGDDLYKEFSLDTAKLAAIIFNDPEKLEQVNHIVHPHVIENFRDWCDLQTGTPYILQEAAIIFESGADKYLDKIITVTAPLELRIERVMKRNRTGREEIMKIVNRQMNEKERTKRSDYIIVNDETTLIIPQVLAIHKELVKIKKL
jgi:dephospho-CoA kinase